MAILSKQRATQIGFSEDKRKRRRQHRQAAQNLLTNCGFFNGYSAPGSTSWSVAQWHKKQARAL